MYSNFKDLNKGRARVSPTPLRQHPKKRTLSQRPVRRPRPLMQFLNPKLAYAFKKIFGSAASSAPLISLLNAVLGTTGDDRIAKVEIRDPYLAPRILGIKDSYVDVRATDEHDRSFIIEMQVLHNVAMEKRVLYNACKAYSGQLTKGQPYHLLTEVIAITFTDFVMFKQWPELQLTFKLRSDQGHLFNDDVQLHFVELPKFAKREAELATMLDKWLYFMRYANEMTEVPAAFAREPALAEAFELANRAGLTREEDDALDLHEKYMYDITHLEKFAEERGEKRGEKRGLHLALERLISSGTPELEARRILGV